MKKLLIASVILMVLLTQVGFVLAEDNFGATCTETANCSGGECCCQNTKGEGICGNTGCTNVICSFSEHTNLESLVKSVTDFIFKLGLIIAPLMIVIGGFIFMTSGGEQSKVTLGKNIMKWAVIGLGII
ncbi:MAG: hypothetical protein HQ539_01830, partial [Parcubacteria group bacterium]|nr:hypothetical protein [Parcubacteria group bacterium]